MSGSRDNRTAGTGDEHTPSGRSKGFVDYEQVADLYRRGRSLPAEVLARWGEAVSPFLPDGKLRVVDIGAGTGVFAAVWPFWADAMAIAVEPAEAMARAGMLAAPAAYFVRGVAEALPLRDGAADVVWVSTALHHFPDVDRAVSEFARVLRSGGRVLVRTYVPGRTEIGYVNGFPGRAKWISRFQTEAELRCLFAAHGLSVVDIVDVLEWKENYAASAQWAAMMRNADSMFTALSDDDMAEGLARLRSTPDVVGRLELTLLVFARQ